MRRGEVWWANLPKPAGRRPVVLLSRDEAYGVRNLVTIAPVTTRVRKIPVEVALSKQDGMPKKCVINADTVTTIPKKFLEERIAALKASKLFELEEAILFSFGIQRKPISSR